MSLPRLANRPFSLFGVERAGRAVGEWWHAFATGYRADRRVRRVLKVGLDFACGATALVVGIVMTQGIQAFGVERLAVAAAGVGAWLVIAEAVSGSYRTIWRYTSLADVEAVAVSSMTVLMGLLLARTTGVLRLSAATILLIALLSLFLSVGTRAARRWQAMERWGGGGRRAVRRGGSRHRVLIVGAGEHGLSICRDLLRPGGDGVEVAGFLDDDAAKIGASLHGVPVLGPLSDVLAVAEQHDISEVIVAMPATPAEVVRGFVRRIEDAGIRVRTVRGVERFVTGRDLHRPGSATIFDLLHGNGQVKPHRGPVRRVLVTGGAGYVGSHLTRLLLDRGYDVRILDRFDYGRLGIDGLQHPRLEIVQGDICNSRAVSQAVKDVDGVLALAAIVGDPACNLDPEETIDLNYAATKILIEACNFYGVRRLVFASSCSVYGANSDGMLTERSRLDPVSLYARTRVLSENILFDRRGDVEPVVLRLATVFGLSPRMRFDLVVNTLTVRAVVDKKIAIFGGDQWRPNVHCRDAARAFTLALEAPAGSVSGEVFNVGGDALNHRIAELGALVAETVGGVEVVMENEIADPRNYRVSFGKIRRVLGFVPEFTVAQGIAEVAAAVQRDPALRHHREPLFHNVQALKQRSESHSRRRELAAT